MMRWFIPWLIPRMLILSVIFCVACERARASAEPLEEDEPAAQVSPAPIGDRLELSEQEWKKRLSAQEFRILRKAGTEMAGSGDLLHNHDQGVYTCAGCGAPLFDSKAKFESGTGWPSYYQPIEDGRVAEEVDSTFGMARTEVLCARCGGHLGHVFADGPKPTGLRYCINSAALDFVPSQTTPR